MNSTTQRFEDTANGFSKEVLKGTEKVKKSAEHLMHEIGDTAKETYVQAKDASQEMIADLKDKYSSQVSTVDKYVRENPIKSAVAGIAIGFMVGRFFKNV